MSATLTNAERVSEKVVCGATGVTPLAMILFARWTAVDATIKRWIETGAPR